jgi:sulfatase maturation enzyme AslB (radical SAM superfamily)
VKALADLARSQMIEPREPRMTALLPERPVGGRLIDQFEYGLDAPICLTWELTYACNLACVHCLSSSGRRDPRELSTAEAEAVIDELQRMQVFYVNVGGGEPTVRPDFWHLLDYAIGHDVGVKFSTNGVKLDRARRPSWPAPTTSTCRSPWTARRPRSTTPSAAPARSPPPPGRWRTWPRPG